MKRLYLVLIIVAIIAVTTTMTRPSIVTAIGVDIVSTYVTEPLPTEDMDSKLWERALPVGVPLSGQQTTQPMNRNASVGTMNIRSLNNGDQVTFLLQWEDEVKDEGGGVVTYRDSVALQFPAGENGDPFSDFICMGIGMEGEETALIDIILWRSDFQRDIEEGLLDVQDIFPNTVVDYYPALDQPDPVTFRTAEAVGNRLASSTRSEPIERLYAEGFGSLEGRESVDATGWGQWADGQWQVIITRPLVPEDNANAPLALGQLTSVAIASWDGDNQEVDGRKSVSSWLILEVQPERTAASLYTTVLPAVLAITGALILTLLVRGIALSRRQRQ
ncbi:MAG: hypothetical protein CL877_06600 [Dehalococcoidales bacterium]|jgi:hypothetical protein|nr:hypothetical protein [Dehalococcoidales bacterium]MDP6221556.1 ethylbenzene dehydrogenase-related protein [Dehalococcoidales bacterium]MDP7409899.1 ethylbenzene dehydrogenase-related protein [Dehalococcoidales bacterium]MDP7675466.1 ethylbenzene dehydrogenase-related protein [Dehalococcoidales bacterium]